MNPIAYFSAEYSIADDLPIYAGGLGILAGDAVMEAGEMRLPFYAIGLVYHQAFTGGDPNPIPLTVRLKQNGFALVPDASGQPMLVSAPVGERVVRAQVWRKPYDQAQLLLLDTNLEVNSEADRGITNQLYDADQNVKLAQQLVLGFGGIDLLHNIGVNPSRYHLNEGHMAFAGVALAVEYQHEHTDLNLAQAIEAVRPLIVATKHTILPGAGITLSREQLEQSLGPVLNGANGNVDDLMKFGGKDDGYFSTTKLMVGLAGKSSGVSAIHVKSEAEAHPDSPLIAITNGVRVKRWRADTWAKPPLELSVNELWHLHNHNRQRLLVHVAAETGAELDPDIITVVWARRMTAYKRPDMLVIDLERLAQLASNAGQPVQFIVSGAANPADTVGVDLMNRVIAAAGDPRLHGRFAYLPHYNPASAALLVQGADVWLNTPIRGQEACGTSGMKASLNGALQLSTSDGWVDEIDMSTIGWVLPEDATAVTLYDIIEQQVAPLFYQRNAETLPEAWIAKMRANITLIEQQFTTKRMLQDYVTKLYT